MIEKWPRASTTFPYVKEIMTSSELTCYYSVQAMLESHYPDENQPDIPDKVLVEDAITIDDDPEDHITASVSATNHIAKATKRPLISSQKERVMRRNANEKRTRPIRRTFTVYTKKLDKGGWFDTANLKNEMPLMPSYSMMHSLDDVY
mmetsp:Transcript_14039/g.13600  ORF Transcript_14039/g.13600 Transcript_14039/m.13600 type:complete len:148 (+) Transcript_14039:1719-2162(+)